MHGGDLLGHNTFINWHNSKYTHRIILMFYLPFPFAEMQMFLIYEKKKKSRDIFKDVPIDHRRMLLQLKLTRIICDAIYYQMVKISLLRIVGIYHSPNCKKRADAIIIR